MAQSVPVRCPACRREHSFTPPTLPCACGAPLTMPLLRGGVPVQIRHRSWNDSWVTLRCPSCGRSDDWPQPEFGCACGATIRIPVDRSATSAASAGQGRGPCPSSGPAKPGAATPARPPSARTGGPAGAPPALRPPFQPVAIRTAADTVTAAVRYLKWLGFIEVRPAEDRVRTGVDVRGKGVVAQVDGDIRPATVKDVECLWLNGLNEDVTGVFFALSGYSRDARLRAEQLGIPLFVLDLTGTPQPVNEAADNLITTGSPSPP